MNQEQIKSWESEIFLISPDIPSKRLLLASLIYSFTMEHIVINDRSIRLAPVGSANETATGAENIHNHMMEMNTNKMYGDIDGAFRGIQNDQIQNELSLELKAVKDARSAADNSLCARLSINGITSGNTGGNSLGQKKPRTLVLILDAEKIVNKDNSDINFYLDTLRTFMKHSAGVAVVTAIGRAEEYFRVYPQGSETELILGARELYAGLFNIIDTPAKNGNGVPVHKEAAYAAANRDHTKLYSDGTNMLDNIYYEPWGISELFRKIVYCSAAVDLALIDRIVAQNEDILLRRIGRFQHSNVRAHLDVLEARKKLSRYLIYRYPLDNSLSYFADPVHQVGA